jgi:hypothetical protein
MLLQIVVVLCDCCTFFGFLQPVMASPMLPNDKHVERVIAYEHPHFFS